MEPEFPDTPVLICAFHAIRAFKARLSGLALLIERNHDVQRHFTTIPYSSTAEDLQKAKDEIRASVPRALVAYYEKSRDSVMCFYHRKELQTLGNLITNRIGAFSTCSKLRCGVIDGKKVAEWILGTAFAC